MCPCARGRWRGDARTGTDGGVRRLRLHAPVRAFLAFDLRCSRCHLTFAVFPAARVGLGVLGAEGVGDALVGGISLPVDAVRVDLEQDGDAVPGPAGEVTVAPTGGASLRNSWYSGCSYFRQHISRPQAPAMRSGFTGRSWSLAIRTETGGGRRDGAFHDDGAATVQRVRQWGAGLDQVQAQASERQCLEKG